MKLNQLMSKALVVSGIALSAATPSLASSDDLSGSQKELLREMKELTLRCVVQFYTVDRDGNKVLQAPKSLCDELWSDGRIAFIRLGERKYRAELDESPNADGGDLDDLTIKNNRGQIVAQRFNVLAFDNVLIALAGGTDQFVQIVLK